MNPAQYTNNVNNGGGMFDIKSLLMLKLIGNQNSTSSTGQDYYQYIYIYVITQLIELFIKYGNYFATIYMKKFNDYVEKKKDSIVETVMQNNIEKKKSATITLHISYKSSDNQRGHAFLDYITNNPNTKHILNYSKINIINQKESVELIEDVFVEKKSEIIPIDVANNNQSQIQNDIIILELYSFNKNVKELNEFLDNIEKNYLIKIKNKLGNKIFYFNMIDLPNQNQQRLDLTGKPVKDFAVLPPFLTFSIKPFETNRKFGNLFGEEIDIIKKRVNFFTANKYWYDTKGIPYTLGLLLSGNPGTGKTSVIKCLANETNRHIININFNNTISKQQLENLFFNEILQVYDTTTNKMESVIIPLSSRIYVIEDIDCQNDIVLERKIKNSKEYIELEKIKQNNSEIKEINIEKKIDLSFLLNLMDGIKETPGRIIIMTANHPDILDEALIRPGRIDIIANFGCCTHKTIIEMIEYFYDSKIPELYLQKIKELPERVLTPAFVSKYLFENMYSMEDGIIKCLNEIVAKLNANVKTEELKINDNLENENLENNDSDNENDNINNVISKNYLVYNSKILKNHNSLQNNHYEKIPINIEKPTNITKMKSEYSKSIDSTNQTENSILQNDNSLKKIDDFEKNILNLKPIPQNNSLENDLTNQTKISIFQNNDFLEKTNNFENNYPNFLPIYDSFAINNSLEKTNDFENNHKLQKNHSFGNDVRLKNYLRTTDNFSKLATIPTNQFDNDCQLQNDAFEKMLMNIDNPIIVSEIKTEELLKDPYEQIPNQINDNLSQNEEKDINLQPINIQQSPEKKTYKITVK